MEVRCSAHVINTVGHISPYLGTKVHRCCSIDLLGQFEAPGALAHRCCSINFLGQFEASLAHRCRNWSRCENSGLCGVEMRRGQLDYVDFDSIFFFVDGLVIRSVFFIRDRGDLSDFVMFIILWWLVFFLNNDSVFRRIVFAESLLLYIHEFVMIDNRSCMMIIFWFFEVLSARVIRMNKTKFSICMIFLTGNR